MPTVSRDLNNNFYVDGRKIELPEFKSLGINADFVRPGTQVDLGQAVSGQAPSNNSATGDPNYDVLLQQMTQYLEELRKRGMAVNPNIEITPEQIAGFTRQAESEIDPYYSTQLKLAREGLLRDQGYSQEQLNVFEQDLEKQYGRRVRDIGESAADRGFAQSGIRGREEQELATDVQSQLDTTRSRLGFQAGTQARQFAQQYGGLQGVSIPGAPQIGATPRVIAGQGTFQRNDRTLPFYELSPDVYQGLIGEQEFQRRAAVRGRTSELEEAERLRRAIQQQRDLTL